MEEFSEIPGVSSGERDSSLEYWETLQELALIFGIDTKAGRRGLRRVLEQHDVQPLVKQLPNGRMALIFPPAAFEVLQERFEPEVPEGTLPPQNET